jgi:hypothetical protein
MRNVSSMTDERYLERMRRYNIPKEFYFLREYHGQESIPTFTNFQGQFITVYNGVCKKHQSIEVLDSYIETLKTFKSFT